MQNNYIIINSDTIQKRIDGEEEVLGFLQEMNDLETRLEGMIYIKKWFEQLKNKQRWN